MAARAWPRANRVRRREDFLRCFEQGTKFYCPHFIVFALRQPAMRSRCGMAVSKRVGNAVVRNRVKRLMREFFRHHICLSAALQIVVVAKKDAGILNYAEVEAELAPIFNRLCACASL